MPSRAARPMQPVYPVFLTNLDRAPVVVVGGGRVAERKVAGLQTVQAAVTVVAPTLTPTLAQAQEEGELTWHARRYTPQDLDGARLVFAATNDGAVNAQVAHDAAARAILCNVADDPKAGTFHVPAVHRSTDTVIAVGSGGRAPGYAKSLRDRLARWLAAAPEDTPVAKPDHDATSL